MLTRYFRWMKGEVRKPGTKQIIAFSLWFALLFNVMAESDGELSGLGFQMVLFSLPVGSAAWAISYAVAIRKDLYRSVWWTVALAPLTAITWIGPLVMVGLLEDRYSKTKGYREARETFLREYPERRRILEEKRANVVPHEIREKEFLENNPGAVLRRAPRDAREFELIVTNWMRFWGEHDAVATQFSGDGGVDVLSGSYGAQVKFYSNKPVGRPEVQALHGAAAGFGVKPAFFAYSTGYTDEALQWAQSMDVACFVFVPGEDNTFTFETNTSAAAELALREEGMSYSDFVESHQLEMQYAEYQNELPPALRKEDPSQMIVEVGVAHA